MTTDFHEEGAEPGEMRCPCGSLIARILKDRVELKCRKCKRLHRIRLPGAGPAKSSEKSRPAAKAPPGEGGSGPV